MLWLTPVADVHFKPSAARIFDQKKSAGPRFRLESVPHTKRLYLFERGDRKERRAPQRPFVARSDRAPCRVPVCPKWAAGERRKGSDESAMLLDIITDVPGQRGTRQLSGGAAHPQLAFLVSRLNRVFFKAHKCRSSCRALFAPRAGRSMHEAG